MVTLKPPRALLDRIRRGLGQTVERLTALRSAVSKAHDETFSPTFDLHEIDGGCLLRAELPGMTTEDIEITVKQKDVTLRGTKRQKCSIEEANTRSVAECRFGEFSRTITLAEDIDEAAVSAHFEHGILEVTLPLLRLREKRPARASGHRTCARGRLAYLTGDDEKIDETVDESFPASDPPGWTQTTIATGAARSPE